MAGIEKKQVSGERLTDEEIAVLKAGDPGYHAEVHALNAAIRAREVRDGRQMSNEEVKKILDSFMVHNVDISGNGKLPPPPCPNCHDIIDGVLRTRPLAATEHLFEQQGRYAGSVIAKPQLQADQKGD